MAQSNAHTKSKISAGNQIRSEFGAGRSEDGVGYVETGFSEFFPHFYLSARVNKGSTKPLFVCTCVSFVRDNLLPACSHISSRIVCDIPLIPAFLLHVTFFFPK